MLALVLLVVLCPSSELASAAFDVAVVPVAVQTWSFVDAGVEVEDVGRHLLEQDPVVADEHDPGVGGSQGVGEEVEPVLVEVVGRLVEEQEVVRRAEQTREADPVAFTDRHRGQPSAAIGDCPQFTQCNVNASVCVPRAERRGVVERRCVGGICACSVLRQRAGGVIETSKRSPGVGEFDVDEVVDGAVLADGDLLLRDPDAADAADRAGVGGQPAGQDVQQR